MLAQKAPYKVISGSLSVLHTHAPETLSAPRIPNSQPRSALSPMRNAGRELAEAALPCLGAVIAFALCSFGIALVLVTASRALPGPHRTTRASCMGYLQCTVCMSEVTCLASDRAPVCTPCAIRPATPPLPASCTLNRTAQASRS